MVLNLHLSQSKQHLKMPKYKTHRDQRNSKLKSECDKVF